MAAASSSTAAPSSTPTRASTCPPAAPARLRVPGLRAVPPPHGGQNIAFGLRGRPRADSGGGPPRSWNGSSWAAGAPRAAGAVRGPAAARRSRAGARRRSRAAPPRRAALGPRRAAPPPAPRRAGAPCATGASARSWSPTTCPRPTSSPTGSSSTTGRVIQASPKTEFSGSPAPSAWPGSSGCAIWCSGTVVKATPDRIQLRWRGPAPGGRQLAGARLSAPPDSPIAFFIRPEYVRLIRKDRKAPDAATT